MSVASTCTLRRREFLTSCGRGLVTASALVSIESIPRVAAEEPSARPLPTALVMDPVFAKHLTGAGHPERPDRYEAVAASLGKAEFAPQLRRITVRPATDEDITSRHARRDRTSG